MSDRPENTSPPETKGWTTPDSASGWQAPATTAEDTPGWQSPAQTEQTTGWRVPALPQNMQVDPAQRGVWHLPKPEDTVFKPGDELEIAQPAPVEVEAEALPVEAVVEAAPADGEDVEALVLPFDDAVEPPSDDEEADEEAEAPVEAVAEEFLPFDQVSEALEAAAEPAEAVEAADEESTADESDSFSMSELMALATLVDEGTGAVVSPEAPPALSSAEDQAAAYAREQLARLEQAATAEPVAEPAAEPAAAAAEPTPDETEELDPAEYARQRLAELRGGDALLGAAVAPVTASQPVIAPVVPTVPTAPAAPALDAQQQELLAKYRQTQQQVAGIKTRYRAGEITREQLQAELRQYMVLDPQDNVWWMMGVETDAWYKFEDNEWVRATPDVLAAAGEGEASSAAPTMQPAATAPTTPQTGAYEYSQPLPREVPQRDLEATVPNTVGMYIPPNQDMGATIPSGAAGATVPSGSYQQTVPGAAFGQYELPAELQQEEDEDVVPSYETDKDSPVFKEALERQKRSTLTTVLIGGGIVIAAALLFMACGVGWMLMQYNNYADPYRDQIAGLANYEPVFRTVRIYDAAGNQMVELVSQQGGAREEVALAEISPFMVFAVVASENERFFSDPGWDAFAIGRAFVQNLAAGEVESGASTITQQIARSLILQDTSLTAERKLQELVVAAEIARQYDKDFILELYLNEVFFGNQSYGVEAAAEFYFNKSAADLNAAEAALLAGIIPAPATNDPVVNRQTAFDRMDQVLVRMRQIGCLQFTYAPYQGSPFCINNELIQLNAQNEISGGAVLIERAEVEVTEFQPREFTLRYPHFVNFVQAQVEQTFGADEMFRRGFQIYTTLVPRIQDSAQTTLTNVINATENTGLNNAAVLVADPTTGAIRAMVGSVDFNDESIRGQVNNVIAYHQPGSAIKPVLYTAALEGWQSDQGFRYFTPASIIWDVPTSYATTPPYAPVNFNRRFNGAVPLRYALQNSYNVAAVKTFYDLTGGGANPNRFVETATRMGLRFQENSPIGLPSALGANEVRLYDMVQAYATLASGGQRVPLFAVVRITDADGNEITLPPRPQPTQAVQPPIAFLMNDILSDNEARAAAFGLNSGLSLREYPDLIAAKTGTTNDNRDLWALGYSTNMVVGVWTGRTDNQATNASTSTAAIPIWNEVMRQALQGTSPRPFANPGGIVTAQVCGETGTTYDPNQRCPTPRSELFFQDQLPPSPAESFIRPALVDTWTGLIANQFCPEAVTEQRVFVALNDPFAVQWLTSSAGAAFAQSLGLSQPVQQLPAECGPNTALPNVRIQSPADASQVQGQVQITGAATGPNFSRYQLELAPATDPNNFSIIVQPVSTPRQPGEVLATWDSTTVPNGIYTLRLSAFASNGGFLQKTIQIGINNPLPTPTNTPIPEPTIFVPPTIAPNDTPLPFPDGGVAPLPFPDAGGGGATSGTLEVPGLGE
jgi:membrane peptidoglycan carboxypeptidase